MRKAVFFPKDDKVIRIAAVCVCVCVWMSVDVKNDPAMAVVGQPARRGGPAAYCSRFASQFTLPFSSPICTSQLFFENRSLVAFPLQLGNEESMGPQLLCEHRSLVDFQIGNEHIWRMLHILF